MVKFKSEYLAYDRLSPTNRPEDDKKKALGRQVTGCDFLAQDAGVTIGRRFSDPEHTSYDRRKVRPDFQEMLKALPEYAGVIVSDGDRLTRNHWDLQQLIALFDDYPHLQSIIGEEDEEGGVRRSKIDLRTEAGRELAVEITARNRRYSTKIAGYQRKRHRQARDNGRIVTNRRPFGLKDDKQTLNLREARLIRRAARNILAGVSANTIAREWNEAGVKTTAGNAWNRRSVRTLLLNPRMTGVRTHQVRGEDGKWKIEPWLHSETGKPVQAHEPILDQATYREVCATLRARAEAKTQRVNNEAKHLFSSLVFATKCGEPMYHQPRRKTSFAFCCNNGCCGIDGPKLYEVVETALLARWAEKATVDVTEPLEPFAEADELADVEASIARLKEYNVAGMLPDEDLIELLIPKRRKRDRLRRKEQAWKVARAQAEVRPTDFISEWNKGKANDDQARLRFLLTGELRRILVTPPNRRGPYFDPTRVRFDWLD